MSDCCVCEDSEPLLDICRNENHENEESASTGLMVIALFPDAEGARIIEQRKEESRVKNGESSTTPRI
jgi:hypothetical protein